jgi:hypothetical protein
MGSCLDHLFYCVASVCFGSQYQLLFFAMTVLYNLKLRIVNTPTLLFLFFHFYFYSHVYTLFGSPLFPTQQLLSETCLPSYMWFCWRENISDNKKDIAFLIICEKDSYKERFLALLQCTYFLQTTFVISTRPLFYFLVPLPIVAFARLRLLYSLLYSEHINHISSLGFFPFPYPSHVHSYLTVWPISNNITAIFGVYNLHIRENMQFLAFWT